MVKRLTIEKRVARIEAYLHLTDEESDRNTAKIDYVAMMTDVELPEEDDDDDAQ